MFVRHKAQRWGWRRATANVLRVCDRTWTLSGPYNRCHLTTAAVLQTSGTEPARNARKSSAKERQRAERDQLIKSLKESPGKRDARNFLKHFDTPRRPPEPAATPQVQRPTIDVVEKAHHNEWRLTRTGVNLGNLYEPTKAIQESPVFTRQELPGKHTQDKESVEPLHLALVKLRQPQMLDDETLGGIALTLSQMARLGLNIAVVVDCDDDAVFESMELTPAWEETVCDESARIVAALEDFNEPGAFKVDQALTYSSADTHIPSTVQVRSGVEVKNNHLLFPPIEDGIIPVIPPFAYDSELRKVRIHPDDVVLAMTRACATTQSLQEGPNDFDAQHENLATLNKPLLDRIIILDPLGGIPSASRVDGAHVFINLEAEYEDVNADLQLWSSASSPSRNSSHRHVRNLDLIQRSLALLPPSSSALIITPAEAAISSQAALLPSPTTGVRTRRSKNPLIHNLLTDKPMISSSLPAPLINRAVASAAPNPATFAKKGIPVTMVPDPRSTGPWQPPSPSKPSIELESDPRIDFPRLVDLIEDSFRRKLDAKHYLDRIRGRVAGVIIAGNYEGGAICTWETPASITSAPPPDSHLWIPYLDKFAVLTQSQGSGGVADIVWGALTRSCFPAGLVWRSRTSNPVNKWYFERALGMWNMSDGYWTMFWTTEGVAEEWAIARKHVVSDKSILGVGSDMSRWDAYVQVCSSVKPSWADGKKPD